MAARQERHKDKTTQGLANQGETFQFYLRSRGCSWWTGCIQNETWFSSLVFANVIFTKGLELLRQLHEGDECLDFVDPYFQVFV